MAVIFNTVKTPNGTPVRTKVEVKLVAGSDPGDPGFLPDDQVTILSRWASGADDNGYWSVELEPNDEFEPEGTYYQIIERYPPGNQTTTYYVRVPDAATPTMWVGDILINDPSAVVTPTGAQDISFTPTGTIIATNVQDAIVEVWQEMIESSGDARYVHTQNTPSATWQVEHNLGKFPSVTIVTSGGTEVEGDVVFVDINTVTLSFSSAFSGKAYCN
jgi:hypothetical protein